MVEMCHNRPRTPPRKSEKDPCPGDPGVILMDNIKLAPKYTCLAGGPGDLGGTQSKIEIRLGDIQSKSVDSQISNILLYCSIRIKSLQKMSFTRVRSS